MDGSILEGEWERSDCHFPFLIHVYFPFSSTIGMHHIHSFTYFFVIKNLFLAIPQSMLVSLTMD